MEKKNKNQKTYYVISVVSLSLFIFAIFSLVLFAFEQGAFTSQQGLERFIEHCGIYAPIVYCILNIVSVIVLVIPSTWYYVVGPMLFGLVPGLILNCFNSFMGSLIIFLMVKRWGKIILEFFVSQKTLDKYYGYLEDEKRFEKWFAFMQTFPFLPDNTFAYIAGCTKMTTKRLCQLVIGFKLWKIIIMGIGTDMILEYILSINLI